jgi:hypothetical protein
MRVNVRVQPIRVPPEEHKKEHKKEECGYCDCHGDYADCSWRDQLEPVYITIVELLQIAVLSFLSVTPKTPELERQWPVSLTPRIQVRISAAPMDTDDEYYEPDLDVFAKGLAQYLPEDMFEGLQGNIVDWSEDLFLEWVGPVEQLFERVKQLRKTETYKVLDPRTRIIELVVIPPFLRFAQQSTRCLGKLRAEVVGPGGKEYPWVKPKPAPRRCGTMNIVSYGYLTEDGEIHFVLARR